MDLLLTKTTEKKVKFKIMKWLCKKAFSLFFVFLHFKRFKYDSLLINYIDKLKFKKKNVFFFMKETLDLEDIGIWKLFLSAYS